MTPTGTNLLGLVKHLIGIEFGYLGVSVDRPAPVPLPWIEVATLHTIQDMWATPAESRDYIVDLYRSAWVHSDTNIRELGRSAPATVPWWPADKKHTTLGALAERVLTDTARHAGQADILRESIDERAGRDKATLGDGTWWAEYVAQVQTAADGFRS
jgi:hypothetical protein